MDSQAKDDADSVIDTLVIADQVRLLYQQSLYGVFSSMVAAALWVAAMWGAVPLSTLGIWLGMLLLGSAIRTGLFFAYRHARPEGAAALTWRVPYMISLFLSASIWGVGTAWVTPFDSLLHLCITYVFLIGLAGAALLVYGVFTYLAVGTVCALLIPILVIFLWRAETVALLLAVAGICFILTSLRVLALHNAAIIQSFRLGHELLAANHRAERLAATDVLTGLNNRRAFTAAAGALLDLAVREKRPAAMLMIDIDNFKSINDLNSHSVGDAALRHLAGILLQQLRGSDLCGRVGGDEFAVLLPNTSTDAAREVADKIGKAVNAAAATDTPHSQFSLSIGLAIGTLPVETMLHHADAAMYQAKHSGKNQVVVAPPLAQG